MCGPRRRPLRRRRQTWRPRSPPRTARAAGRGGGIDAWRRPPQGPPAVAACCCRPHRHGRRRHGCRRPRNRHCRHSSGRWRRRPRVAAAARLWARLVGLGGRLGVAVDVGQAAISLCRWLCQSGRAPFRGGGRHRGRHGGRGGGSGRRRRGSPADAAAAAAAAVTLGERGGGTGRQPGAS